MRTDLLLAVLMLLICGVSQSVASPILSTNAPPFPIKTCPKNAGQIPFEPVPDFLKENPELLEAFLASVNPEYASKRSILSEGKTKKFPSFTGIASAYEKWCSAYGLRWDMAFIQMLHETNFLQYTGSVQPNSYNFAGLSALHETSGGEHFLDMQHGVKAHCQHLAAYALIDLPSKKCATGELENLACLEANRTLSVKDTVIRYNVCKQFGRPAQFDELGPDDVRPCTERKIFIRGQSLTEKLCPNDIVRWATGPLATGYSATLNKFYSQFLEKFEHCKSVLTSAANKDHTLKQQSAHQGNIRRCIEAETPEL